MKFTLKDYQEEAVKDVLVNLKKASRRWREDKDKHAFSLTATTGAGKTVMAAAVFEALFHGDDNYDIEPDPGAVVIWFSDDPSLNEQSRFRLLDADSVLPLMVLQVPNSPDPNDIGRALDTIFERWPDLPDDAIAHVFGEHTAQTFGRHTVPYISPERVQESNWVRILIAKDAISTGWDCPRAEVMVSFRPAKDKTHITQLLGRMVRTPLARRIPGNDRLNAVDCLLPFFDEQSVRDVAKALMSGGDGSDDLLGRRVLINPTEVKPNPAIAEAVWERLLSLPSQTLPKRQARPVKRLTSLAHELAADGLLPEAGKLAHADMHKVLQGASGSRCGG